MFLYRLFRQACQPQNHTGKSAEPLLTDELALRPEDFTARMQGGLGYVKSERFDLAMQDFEAALRL